MSEQSQNVNGTLNARRSARDQESGLAATGLIGFNLVRPIFQFQAQMLRQWSELCDITSRNAESMLQAIGGGIEQQQDEYQQGQGRHQSQGRQQQY